MKKIIVLTVLALAATLTGAAQKFAFVDSEYIRNNIPAFIAAQQKLDELSAGWEKEVSDGYAAVEQMYKDYQAERVLLTEEMRTRREDEIIQKEKDVKELQKKYFAPEGMLFKKRQELVKPIQDDVFNAVKDLAAEGGYSIIFDVAAGPTMLFTDPKYDKSDEILKKMGIQN